MAQENLRRENCPLLLGDDASCREAFHEMCIGCPQQGADVGLDVVQGGQVLKGTVPTEQAVELVRSQG